MERNEHFVRWQLCKALLLLSFLPPPRPQLPSILAASNALPSCPPLKLPSVQIALGFRMLLLVALFVSSTAFFGCAASRPSPGPTYVVDVRRPRGLVPRQNIAGVMLGPPDDIPGTGITPLVLASDHTYALIYPILVQTPFGPNPLAPLQLILCHHFCGEHQLQTGSRHGILGHVHYFDRLSVDRLPFDPKVPPEIPESHVCLSQRKHHCFQRELRGRNLCVVCDRVPEFA